MEHQDWNPVVLRGAALKETGAAEERRRHPGLTPEERLRRQLDTDPDEADVPQKTSVALRTAIQQARVAKNMTQEQLAKAVNLKKDIINAYESGKAVPETAVLQRLSRALGVSLSSKA